MKISKFVLAIGAILLLAGAPVWGAKGGTKGKPPPSPDDPSETPISGYYFWRLGHMDGPHDMSMALGISRDGKVAVGTTDVVDFWKAFRIDIDWAISTGDGVAPLYNELQVQENIGNGEAYAASNMDGLDVYENTVLCDYDKVDPEDSSSIDNLVWCGSQPVGTLTKGTVSYAAEWLFAFDPEATEDDPVNYAGIPDFGGGISGMVANDVSADGMIIVGTGNVEKGQVAFLADWTTAMEDPETGELIPEPLQLNITEVTEENPEGQTLQTSSAEAVSMTVGVDETDLIYIAGYGATKRGNNAFFTIFEGTVVDGDEVVADLTSTILPTIAGGKFAEAYAMTVTDEGVVYIAGRSDSPKGPQACIWFQGDDPETADAETDAWLVKGLGGLSKRKYDSVATGIVHRPGSTAGELMVVGTSQSIRYPSEAFVWTGNPVLEPDAPDGGYELPDGSTSDYIGYMYDLEKILIKTGAGEASGLGSAWILNEATGVALSDVLNDGENGPSARIVGWGTNPEGGGEAWLVTNYPYDDLVFVKEE